MSASTHDVSDVARLLLCCDDLGASICIVMSGAMGNWALMSRESESILEGLWLCCSGFYTVCHPAQSAGNSGGNLSLQSSRK